ncbi:MAG: divergent polysaccharide deacetylase family protein [Alphaproteobacteria bacterium]|nr:divergent polysaccharide deacetylase family protein [Alphaproteobacteria bacterium]
MKRYASPRGTLQFILVAIILMILVDGFILGGFNRGVKDLPLPQPPDYSFTAVQQGGSRVPQTPLSSPRWAAGDLSSQFLMDLPHSIPLPAQDSEHDFLIEEEPPPVVQEPVQKKTPVQPSPPAYRYSAKNSNPGKPAKLVIIIDDLGMDRKRSGQVIEIKAPLTLAFLPYAENLKEITERAKEGGHELLIHMPMEPLNAGIDPGPIALLDGMAPEAFDAALEKAFLSFDGYIGINNHMGSKLTREPESMERVMRALKRRGLAFVDSKTIHDSVAGDMARRYGLDYAERDVFLDHQDTEVFVAQALAKLERVALEKGSAIAIGHPKDSTITVLNRWLPTLKERGFEVVPVSEVLNRPLQEEGEQAGLSLKPLALDAQPLPRQQAEKQAERHAVNDTGAARSLAISPEMLLLREPFGPPSADASRSSGAATYDDLSVQ